MRRHLVGIAIFVLFIAMMVAFYVSLAVMVSKAR